MSYVPEYIELWEYPYGWEELRNHYFLADRCRFSGLLDSVNFDSLLAEIEERGGEYGVDYHIYRNGTLEVLLIPQGSNFLQWADETWAALETYPVYDDDAYHQLEHELVMEYWADLGTNARIREIKRFSTDLSIFSARRGNPYDIDPDFYYHILEYIR